MSKNVAVFVDVANIFYAAKAAGADIDYVTLLKSAVAGRDFVRAYAYTGLDPENENQRQFHSFLARNGYKVVSKDIRKYGDGRIKANLDIELVVDLIRTARNLDIAVVVSGDGDFAPAIRAVQQMGVRVEVISFRGNTSSDLIDVADQFIDIAQVARVDKDSGRSGRRVAAEGDLSMTEVPDKETEGAPRRRRGGRGRDGEREDRVAALADASAAGASLTAMPGERLSRAAAAALGNGEAELIEDGALASGEGVMAGDEIGPDGNRRRRRRGGRGRGRGRRGEGEGLPAEEVPAGAGAGEDEEDFEAVMPPPPPPHQAFGAVWDSQLGVPGGVVTPTASSSGAIIDSFEPGDDDLDEPEIPEYLLAERRQRGGGGAGGGRGRMGRGRGAYQAALDRERYGRSATPQPSGFGTGRLQERSRPDRGRGNRPQRGERSDRPRFERPMQAQRPVGGPAVGGPPVGGGHDPWSEVPPDLEEMLRAELARKTTAPVGRPAPEMVSQPSEEAPATEAAAPARRTRTRRTTATVAAETATPASSSETDAQPEAKPKRTTRPRTTKAAAEPPAQDESKPARTRRTRTTASAVASEAEAAESAEAKPTRRRRTKAEGTEPAVE